MCLYKLLKPSYYIPLTTGQIPLCFFSMFVHLSGLFFAPPFEEERAYYFAHVGRSVCWSFCPSVTFSFPTDKWRTPWPTFLKLCPHIRGTLLILRSLGQRSRVPKPFPINNSRTITFLKLCPHIQVWQQRTLLILGSKVKGTRVQCSKTISDCLSNNFPKWISSSYICATYFELTYPVVQNICDKKNLGVIMFYEHLLFKLHLQAITFIYHYISYKQWILEPVVLWFYM